MVIFKARIIMFLALALIMCIPARAGAGTQANAFAQSTGAVFQAGVPTTFGDGNINIFNNNNFGDGAQYTVNRPHIIFYINLTQPQAINATNTYGFSDTANQYYYHRMNISCTLNVSGVYTNATLEQMPWISLYNFSSTTHSKNQTINFTNNNPCYIYRIELGDIYQTDGSNGWGTREISGYNTTITGGAPPVGTTLIVVAKDYYNGATISDFGARVYNSTNSTYYTTGIGSLSFPDLAPNTNYTIEVNASGFLTNVTRKNITASITYNVYLDSTRNTVTYTGNITNQGKNWVRNLTIASAATGCYNTLNLSLLVNGNYFDSKNITCSGRTGASSITYTTSSTDPINLSTMVFGGNSTINYTGNTSFYFDTTSPVLNFSYTVLTGFVNSSNIQFLHQCRDAEYNNLSYFSSLNGGIVLNRNFTANTINSNYTSLSDGNNIIVAKCADLFSQVNETYNFSAYGKVVFLWDEIQNVPFNISNVTTARLWFENSTEYYDFISQGRSNVSLITTNITNVRAEIGYPNGDTVTSYIDLSLLTGDSIKICANKDGVKHYQQFVVSSTKNRIVAVRNSYVPCYIAVDYTRFAYETYYNLQMFTINSLYSVATVSDGQTVWLASIDGSVQATSINLDQLEFQRQQVKLNTAGDALSFRTINGLVQLYYKNTLKDNDALTLTISDMEGSALVSISNFSDLNEWTLYFNASVYGAYNSSTLFKAQVDSRAGTNDKTLKVYFNNEAKSGLIPAGVAFALSLLLMIFGLTLASARITFGWFGLFIMIAAIILNSFSISTWYSLWLMAVESVVLVYIGVLTFREGTGGLA